MLDQLEQQKTLTINQWKIFTACLFSIVIDFFDFALIGFVLAFFVKDWHLTFGQSGAILFASGIASIPGAIFFGWLGDKVGRRAVFMMMILTLSVATGVMALAPDNGWLFIAAMRFIVGLAVGGLGAVDLPLMQEFVPASKRGWISGLSIGLLPLGPLLAALLSATLGATIGWRGLFAVGLVPAAFAFVIRLWVPESPRWLLGQGRFEEARRSLAWALMVDPSAIRLPAVLTEPERASWLELFRYPRSIIAGILTGLSSTGAVGVALWSVTLLVLVLRITPAEAAYLSVWIALVGIPGRVLGAWLSDALGRRPAGVLLSIAAGGATLFTGYWHNVYIGSTSAFFLLLMAGSFFANASFSIVFPYMAELWPAKLRASGFGLVYGCSNLAKFIGPAGLAVIAGASNYVAPKATLAAMVPAFGYFAAWYALAVIAFLFIGIETRGRTIEELDAALAAPAAAPAVVRAR
ncbi:MAG TPA: MFS transporter [Stellaceae bacterium]|nr:MFS transporter [Stellaceae bacterium]